MAEVFGFPFVVCEKLPANLREKGRRIVAKDETPEGGAAIEAFQMPEGGPVYITRLFTFTAYNRLTLKGEDAPEGALHKS